MVISNGLATWEAPISIGKCTDVVEYVVTYENDFESKTVNVGQETSISVSTIPCINNTVRVTAIINELKSATVSVTLQESAQGIVDVVNLKSI